MKARCFEVVSATALVCAIGCGNGTAESDSGTSADTGVLDSTAGDTVSGGPGSATSSATSTSTSATTDTATTGDFKFDVLMPDADTAGGDVCKVSDDGQGVGECEQQAPPDSFEPDVQWAWEGENGETMSITSALVGNLTDDNGDGEIDLCDIPDVVVVVASSCCTQGHIYVLDGETGTVHMQLAEAVNSTVTPAIGDIDGDGIMEIVSVQSPGDVHDDGLLIAWDHDGTKKFDGDAPFASSWSGAIALADLDNDGDVEILSTDRVSTHTGTTIFSPANPVGWFSTPTAADLDDDGDLEVVFGRSAYHHDGTLAFENMAIGHGHPQIADFDDDGLPEILVTNRDGLTLLEHTGAVVYQDLRPTGVAGGGLNWIRPAAVHDMDGDDDPEYAVSSATAYAVYEADASISWQAVVSDLSGLAGGTAFDFLGSGIAQAMYGDENNLFVFDGNGNTLFQTARGSLTLIEYPVVADVDDDGSAEIVVTSNSANSPAVQVVRDIEDRWIQGRRIWNQHTYHVTNVREDGTIPQFEPPSWQALNTFRTQAQIEGGGICEPPG